MRHVFLLFLGVNCPTIFLCVQFDGRVVFFVVTTRTNPGSGAGGHGGDRLVMMGGLFPGSLVECDVAELSEQKNGIVHQSLIGEDRVGETASIFGKCRRDHTTDPRSFLDIQDGVKSSQT